MRSDLTDITLVIDRSGSMQAIRNDAQGGVNAFIAGQSKMPGEVLVTLVQFDTEYEFIHKGVPIGDVPPYELHPRGGTALLDAVGRAINETGKRLAELQAEDRPGLVIFVVMTDGEENSSREFTRAQVKEMIERQQTAFNWHFTFLGANQDAFAEAGGIGIPSAGAADFASAKVANAWIGTGNKVMRMRTARAQGDAVDNSFTQSERDEMK
jgi:uncharacterized protein YegL